MTIKGDRLHCQRCGHEWKQGGEDPPKQCGNRHCGSPYWNRPREQPQPQGKEMAMAKDKVPCPDCAHNAQAAQEANDKAAKLQGDNDRLAGELAAASTPRDFDTLTELIGHCESGDCAAHSEEWSQVKEKIVAAAYEQIPTEVLFAKAQDRGILPKRIVIGGTG